MRLECLEIISMVFVVPSPDIAQEIGLTSELIPQATRNVLLSEAGADRRLELVHEEIDTPVSVERVNSIALSKSNMS
jgi:hypothetical protein